MLVLRPFMLELVVRSMMLCLWGATALVGQCVSIILCMCKLLLYGSFCVSRDYCMASLEKHFSDNFFQEKFSNGSCG